MNLKHDLFIAIIIIAETTKLTITSQFQHMACMFTESDINRTRKLEVNKCVYEPCHAISKQTA